MDAILDVLKPVAQGILAASLLVGGFTELMLGCLLCRAGRGKFHIWMLSAGIVLILSAVFTIGWLVAASIGSYVLFDISD